MVGCMNYSKLGIPKLLEAAQGNACCSVLMMGLGTIMPLFNIRSSVDWF